MPCGSSRRYYKNNQDCCENPTSNKPNTMVTTGNYDQTSSLITEEPEYSEKYLKSQKNYCFNCGNKINQSDIFCSNCGVKIP